MESNKYPFQGSKNISQATGPLLARQWRPSGEDTRLRESLASQFLNNCINNLFLDQIPEDWESTIE